MYAGFRSVIMPPVAFLQRPFRWVKAISNYQASYSAGPNFAYDLCVRKTTPEQRASLNLSSWQSALNAAEPIRCETLERFAAAFEPAGFRYEYFKPGYGLAEATLKVACLEKGKTPLVCAFESDALAMNRIIAVSRAEERAKFEREDYHNVMKLVGCGTTMSDLFEVHVVIANPETMTRCAPNEVGEIWVSGPSITGGYWNRPDETDQTFNAYLRDTVEAPFLRTGDLGFIYMGELFVTGRLKDLIIIDGLNHYPQDIEYTIDSCHSAIRPGCSAAFSLDVDAQERVVIVTEVKPEYLAQVDPSRSKLSRQEIIKAIRSAVADEHGLQIHSVALIKAGTIPKTSSGKIQRYACRAQFLDGTLELCD
jgi:acyl-CoA synthetase (AMP-forming)/AMP-acid ligase II